MAAPIYNVSPQMGADLIIVVFAVVVIGGMGSIMGAIVTGFGLGIIEGLTKVFFPEASNTVIFVIMAIVLLIRPAGLFGRRHVTWQRVADPAAVQATPDRPYSEAIAFVLMAGVLIVAPLFVYPVFLMKALCFALFACAFNLLIGYVGLLSFGHALYFGWASYVSAHTAKVWGLPPELRDPGRHRRPAPALGLVVGLLAIRRQGIYFAMITLALAQMMYFFAVQAPFTGGEDGIQAVPRGRLFGFIDLADQLNMYFTVLVDLSRRLPADLPHHPFAVRRGAQGDPRERAARDLARLQDRPLQARRLRAVGDARRPRRRDQGDRVPARLAHRRRLDRCRARSC